MLLLPFNLRLWPVLFASLSATFRSALATVRFRTTEVNVFSSLDYNGKDDTRLSYKFASKREGNFDSDELKLHEQRLFSSTADNRMSFANLRIEWMLLFENVAENKYKFLKSNPGTVRITRGLFAIAFCLKNEAVLKEVCQMIEKCIEKNHGLFENNTQSSIVYNVNKLLNPLRKDIFKEHSIEMVVVNFAYMYDHKSVFKEPLLRLHSYKDIAKTGLEIGSKGHGIIGYTDAVFYSKRPVDRKAWLTNLSGSSYQYSINEVTETLQVGREWGLTFNNKHDFSRVNATFNKKDKIMYFEYIRKGSMQKSDECMLTYRKVENNLYKHMDEPKIKFDHDDREAFIIVFDQTNEKHKSICKRLKKGALEDKALMKNSKGEIVNNILMRIQDSWSDYDVAVLSISAKNYLAPPWISVSYEENHAKYENIVARLGGKGGNLYEGAKYSWCEEAMAKKDISVVLEQKDVKILGQVTKASKQDAKVVKQGVKALKHDIKTSKQDAKLLKHGTRTLEQKGTKTLKQDTETLERYGNELEVYKESSKQVKGVRPPAIDARQLVALDLKNYAEKMVGIESLTSNGRLISGAEQSVSKDNYNAKYTRQSKEHIVLLSESIDKPESLQLVRNEWHHEERQGRHKKRRQEQQYEQRQEQWHEQRHEQRKEQQHEQRKEQQHEQRKEQQHEQRKEQRHEQRQEQRHEQQHEKRHEYQHEEQYMQQTKAKEQRKIKELDHVHQEKIVKQKGEKKKLELVSGCQSEYIISKIIAVTKSSKKVVYQAANSSAGKFKETILFGEMGLVDLLNKRELQLCTLKDSKPLRVAVWAYGEKGCEYKFKSELNQNNPKASLEGISRILIVISDDRNELPIHVDAMQKCDHLEERYRDYDVITVDFVQATGKRDLSSVPIIVKGQK